MKTTHTGALLLPLLFAAPVGSQAQKPNVIYICFDDMCTDWGIYGDSIAHTPNFDSFARESVLFNDVHCQVALSTPSRTSVLTGVRPSTSKSVEIKHDWQQLLPGVTSLPRHFRNNGYFTSLAGKVYDRRWGAPDSAFDIERSVGQVVTTNDYPLEALREAATHSEPIFLAIGYFQTHLPWLPTEGSKRWYNPADISVENRHPVYKGKTMSREEIQLFMRDYYAYQTDADSLFGELIAEIKRLGLYDNSIILVGSFDHGYCHGYGGKWAKGDNTDHETRVPLAVRIPGNPNNGQSTSGIVELVDVYPTLIDLCGLPAPNHQLEGISFRKLLEAPDTPWKKAAFTHRAYHINDVGVKTADYTLIRTEGEPIRLHNRKTDPNNLHNIANDNPQIVSEMLAILNAGWTMALPPERYNQ